MSFLQSGFNKMFWWFTLLTEAFFSHSFKIMIDINGLYVNFLFFLLLKIKLTKITKNQLLDIKRMPHITLLYFYSLLNAWFCSEVLLFFHLLYIRNCSARARILLLPYFHEVHGLFIINNMCFPFLFLVRPMFDFIL